ncbi:MAG TPA: FkbM family methyltransferase [Smithella sp.]|nr:FkbM family methyltransferase [Smithella sp.]
MKIIPGLPAKQTLKSALTRKILGPHACAVIIKSGGDLFAVDPEDMGVGGALRRDGKYCSDEVERFRPHLKPEGRVLIVGAHVGILAIPISKLCGEVVAIEANPSTCELLKINIMLNSAGNCRAVNIAANDQDENIDFLLSKVNSGGSKRVPKIKENMYYYDDPQTISVKACRLDKFLEEKNFDVVVMDIEGSEYFALLGMQDIISRCKMLSVEFLPHHLKNVGGVTVEQFLSVIAPHFSRLTIPSKGIVTDASGFIEHLTRMYDLDQRDEIMFEKI